MLSKDFSCYTCFSTKLMVARFPSEHNEGILILESSPYPSYISWSGFPDNLKSVKDHHLYLVVKKPFSCFQDRVIRYSYKIMKKMDLSLHVSPGQISLQNETHPCIRIRTEETAQLKPFITTLKQLGIQFMADKKIKPYEALIQFKRYTNFKNTDDDIFIDKENSNRHFIPIPVDIDYETFEKMIKDIKNNCDFHMFDASLVYLNCGDRFVDMVSVYSEHCEERRLPELKKSLDEEVKRLHLPDY